MSAAHSINETNKPGTVDPVQRACGALSDAATTLRTGVQVFGWVGVINRTIADLMSEPGELDPHLLRLRVQELAKIAAHLAYDCANAIDLVREDIERGTLPALSEGATRPARWAPGNIPPAAMPATRGGAK